METSSLILNLLLLFIHAKSVVVDAAKWNYTVQQWSGICSSGKKQSPINIVTKDAGQMNSNALIWKNNATHLGNVTVKNGGHGFSVSGDSMKSLILSGGGLKGQYQLAQFHYHWGSGDNSFKGSEHRIDGNQWASELHLVHFKTDYADLTAALGSKKEDALAVVGVMLKRDARKAAGHEKILMGAINEVREPTNTTVVDMGSEKLLNLLPKNVKKFFRYEGSLTTPTCNQQVIWTVLEEEVTIAQSLLNKFVTVKDADHELLKYSARDAMPLNERKVLRNAGTTASQIPLQHVFTVTIFAVSLFL